MLLVLKRGAKQYAIWWSIIFDTLVCGAGHYAASDVGNSTAEHETPTALLRAASLHRAHEDSHTCKCTVTQAALTFVRCLERVRAGRPVDTRIGGARDLKFAGAL